MTVEHYEVFSKAIRIILRHRDLLTADELYVLSAAMKILAEYLESAQGEDQGIKNPAPCPRPGDPGV